jgi:hypothetical protein
LKIEIRRSELLSGGVIMEQEINRLRQKIIKLEEEIAILDETEEAICDAIRRFRERDLAISLLSSGADSNVIHLHLNLIETAKVVLNQADEVHFEIEKIMKVQNTLGG